MKNMGLIIILIFLAGLFYVLFQMMKQKTTTTSHTRSSSFWDNFFNWFNFAGRKSYGCVAGFEWSEEHQACVPIPGYWD